MFIGFYAIIFIIGCVCGFANTNVWWSDKKIWLYTLAWGFGMAGLVLCFDLIGWL